MKGKSFIVLAVLFLCACPALGWRDYRDGLTHDIDYEITDDVVVDFRSPGMGTTVNWLDGGSMEFPYALIAHENSRINVLGGGIYHLASCHFGQVNISGGSIDYINNSDFSQVDISGGLIGTLISHDSSWVNISGGSIGGNLRLWDESMVQIFGLDFAVDGVPFGYGELTSILSGSPYDEPWRHLTGTLQSGEVIDNDFYVGHDARIILVPEPATLLLFGLGAVVLRKRS